jgi:hypothetical protein
MSLFRQTEHADKIRAAYISSDRKFFSKLNVAQTLDFLSWGTKHGFGRFERITAISESGFQELQDAS